jgi:hypothetical protein
MELSLNLITHLTPKTTKQELFDYVASFLLKQGKRSFTGGGCMYRGDNGLMCAAGCVIPDEFYDPVMEGNDINSVVSIRRKTKGPQQRFWKTLEKHLGLLSELQEVHDNLFSPNDTRQFWLKKLREVAADHKLAFDKSLTQLAQRTD